MKKNRITLLLCAILCFVMLFSLVSCEQAKAPEEESTAQQKEKRIVGYQVLETSLYDIADHGKHSPEVPLWDNSEMTQDPFASEQRSVNFCGKTYTGVYQSTHLQRPNLRQHHFYQGENFSFSLEKGTGELMSFQLSGIGYEYEPDYTEEDAIALAKEVALGHGVNTDTYKVEVTKDNDKRYDFHYQVTFYREVEGIRTNDAICVEMNRNGVVTGIHKENPGSFDGVNSHGLDMTAINDAIQKKLDAIYKNNTHIRSQVTREDTLIRWTDGSVALFVEVEIIFKEEIFSSYTGRADLLVLPIYEEVTE